MIKNNFFYWLKFKQLLVNPVLAILIVMTTQIIHKVIHRICE